MELNKIYNMDCVEGLKLLPDNFIDLTITSPPYDNLRTYNGFSWDFEATARELYRITKQGGIKGSETGTSFRQALYFMECGFNLHDTMIWDKGNLTFPCPTRYHSCFEYMFVFSKGKPKTTNLIEDRKNKWSGEKIHGTDRQKNGKTIPQSGVKIGRKIKEIGKRFNVWRIPPCQSNRERSGHPAQFPEQLANDHIISWSNEGDVILDCFMGSGTTAKMAVLNNRNYIGFEISEEYCDIANSRMAQVRIG